MKRIFIGIKINLNGSLKRVVQNIRNELSGEKIRWTRDENIHITLKFIGNITDQNLELLQTNLLDLEYVSTFAIEFKSLGVFPSVKKPRIFWMGISSHENLLPALKIVREKTVFLKLKDQTEHHFTPHLTLGLMKFIKDKTQLQRLINDNQDIVFGQHKVSQITLFQSKLFSTGPVYEAIKEYELR